jgi:hypothetical protein
VGFESLCISLKETYRKDRGGCGITREAGDKRGKEWVFHYKWMFHSFSKEIQPALLTLDFRILASITENTFMLLKVTQVL